MIETKKFFYTLGQVCLPASAFFVTTSVTGASISMSLAVACSILSGAFIRCFRQLIKNELIIAILLFFGFAVLSVFWGEAPWGERLNSLHKYDKLLYVMFLMPLCVEEKWRNRSINAFLFGMLITVSISLLIAYTSFTWGHPPNDPTVIFYNHIETSYLVAFSAFIFLHRAVYETKLRWLNVILFCLFTFQEFFINDGRTGWVVYFVLIILFFFQMQYRSIKNEVNICVAQKIKQIVKGVSLGLLVVACFGSVLLVLSKNVQDVVLKSHSENGYGESIRQRAEFIPVSFEIVQSSPVLGLGPGAFPERHQNLTGGRKWDHPHNEYLLTLVQFGIVGLFLLLYLFYVQLRLTFKKSAQWSIAQALVLSVMFASLFNPLIYTTVTGRFYVIFLALCFFDQLKKVSYEYDKNE